MSNNSDPKRLPKLTNSGARRALNYIQELVQGEKETVTFYRDNDGTIRELATKREIDVTGGTLKSNDEAGP